MHQRKMLLCMAGVAGCVAGAVAIGYFGRYPYNYIFSKMLPLLYENVNDEEHLSNEFMSGSYKWDYNWDKREPLIRMKGSIDSEKDENNDNEKQEKAKPSATRHLLLVRPGHYNRSRDSPRTLTPLGREQAKLIGLRLKELAHPYTRIIGSNSNRDTETAQIISQHLPDIPVKSCDLIRKGSPIEPVPARRQYTPEEQRAAFRKYFHRADPEQKEDSYEVFVCHENVIRYFICRAIQLPPQAWQRYSLFHGSLTWIMIKPNGLVGVVSVGDMGHITKDKLSYY